MLNLNFYSGKYIEPENFIEMVKYINKQDIMIRSLLFLLAQKNIITIEELDEMVDSILVMNKLTGEI